MSWLKVSDAFAMHPMLLQVLEFPETDDRLLNEFAGFITRCSTSAAAYETDYVITKGMVQTLAGSFARNQVLCRLALQVGIFTEMKDPRGRLVYKLIEEEDLVHMVYKAERLWRNRQKNDNRNPKLTAPVRKRDGDECRWCGKVVNWNDRKSGKGGTYDHLNPGHGAASPDEMVVCCFSCNAERRNDAPSWTKTLLDAPLDPYYSQETVIFLARQNINVKPSNSLPVEVKGAEPTVSLVPVEPTDAVEPAKVEPAAVEPETLAPAATGPKATGPAADVTPGEESFDFDLARMDEELENAPGWVREAAQSTEEVEPAAVEPETLAPAATGPAQAPWATQTVPNEISGRFGQIFTVTDLDLSGRDGITRGNSYTHSESVPEASSESNGKKRRRRRRRR